MSNGTKEVVSEGFVMDIDLTVPESKLMGTHTVKDRNGIRIQFSGAVFKV